VSQTDAHAAPPLPYARHLVDEADIAAVTAVLRSDWLTQGKTVAEFEAALARQVGTQEAVAVSSGSAALDLVGLALGLEAGEAAIVPAITFAATANAFQRRGASVFFADVDPIEGNVAPETARAAIQRAREAGLQPRVLVAVSMAGKPPDLPGLKAVAHEEQLFFLEDAAHSLGATYEHAGQTFASGSCAHTDAATLSFHPSKLLTCGEGGALLTANTRLASQARALRTSGVIRPENAHPEWLYDQVDCGHNFRLSELHAALGLSQLKKLRWLLNRRRELASALEQALRGEKLDQHLRLPEPSDGHAWHLYVVHFADAQTRDAAYAFLKARNIITQVHYRPLYQFSHYKDKHAPLPGAERWFNGCLSLPLFPSMSDHEMERVVDGLKAFFKSL